MFDDLTTIVDALISWFKMMWQAFGTWGILGAFIIGIPILRKVCMLLKSLWKGGL